MLGKTPLPWPMKPVVEILSDCNGLRCTLHSFRAYTALGCKCLDGSFLREERDVQNICWTGRDFPHRSILGRVFSASHSDPCGSMSSQKSWMILYLGLTTRINCGRGRGGGTITAIDLHSCLHGSALEKASKHFSNFIWLLLAITNF